MKCSTPAPKPDVHYPCSGPTGPCTLELGHGGDHQRPAREYFAPLSLLASWSLPHERKAKGKTK